MVATVECSAQSEGQAPASSSFEDCTNALFGVANLTSAAVPATALWIVDTPVAFKYCRLKIAAATGGNSGDATAYLKKMF